MNHRFRFGCLVLSALLVFIASPAATAMKASPTQARLTATLVEDPEVEGVSLEYRPTTGFSVQTPAGAKIDLAALDVVDILFSPDETKNAESSAPPHEVLLVGGDRVHGTILDGDENGLTLESRALGKTSIPIDLITQITFRNNLRRGDLDSFPLKDETDTAYRRTFGGRDAVTGVVLEFDKNGVTLDSTIGEYRIEFGDLLALTLLPQIEVKETEELSAKILCYDGSYFQGILNSISGQTLRLTSKTNTERTLDLEAVKTLSFKNGRFVFLSDLEPTEVEQTPFIGTSDDFLFPFRKDRSVSGNPLTIGGSEFSRGLGVHSRCKLTYSLGAGYRLFRASIGVDDESLALRKPGTVTFAVFVDGKERFKSRIIRAGTPALKIGPIDVQSARELTLLVDFGDDHHFGDRADWADAMLIR